MHARYPLCPLRPARRPLHARARAGHVSWLPETRDPLGQKRCVLPHPADESRAARVLPGETEEVEPRHIGYSAAMAEASVRVEDRKVDPRVIGPVARRPDDGVDLDLAAVLERNRAPGSTGRARLQLDAVLTLELARARPDQRVPMLQPAVRAATRRSPRGCASSSATRRCPGPRVAEAAASGVSRPRG